MERVLYMEYRPSKIGNFSYKYAIICPKIISDQYFAGFCVDPAHLPVEDFTEIISIKQKDMYEYIKTVQHSFEEITDVAIMERIPEVVRRNYISCSRTFRTDRVVDMTEVVINN